MLDIFKRLFNNDAPNPIISFGRYSDYYKPIGKLADWDEALDLYEKKKYFDSFRKFLSYISDDTIENVIVTGETEDKIFFQLFQGSKTLKGFANIDGVFAEAPIVNCQEMSLPLMKELLEENYHLKYSSYALDSENNFTMMFYTDYEDASPYKLYYGLKEIALNADKKDDVLLKKFPKLISINQGQITPISDYEKQVKYDFLIHKISSCLQTIHAHETVLAKHQVLVSYKLLSTIYLIDYMLKPEGLLMEAIEKIHIINSSSSVLHQDKRLNYMINELEELLKINKSDVFDELYQTKNTFGVITPGNHLRLKESIAQEMVHYDWYIDHDLKDFALEIPKFIIGTTNYSYALPLPDKLLLDLLLRVLENDFFIKLGYKSILTNHKLDISIIKKELEIIVEKCKDEYQELNLELNLIDEPNFWNFCKAYLQMVSLANVKKKA